MSKRWSKDDTFTLINLYEANPILWDIKSVEYRNREKRNIILAKISGEMGCSSEEIVRKIYNLRNQVSIC